MKKKPTVEKTMETLLADAGLSQKEGRIYRVLLEHGTMDGPRVVQQSGLKKGITYLLLHKLAKDELIIKFERDGQLYFQLNDPAKLREYVERRKQSFNEVLSRLDRMLPEMRSSYKLAVGKPTIRYFEGAEGIRTVFEDIYGKKKVPVYGCVDFEKSDEAVPSYIVEKLIPKRIRNKVLAISFVADSVQARELAAKDVQEMRQTWLVEKNKYPLPAEIDVYEDKIAMLSFSRGEFLGILIENPDFAESLRSIFRLAFAGTPKVPENRKENALG